MSDKNLQLKEHTKKDFLTSLEALRSQIDALDRDIAALLLKRCELVGKVGKLKAAQKTNRSFIHARREAVMLRDLIAHFEKTSFPRAAVASIWRTIIGASTRMECPLELSILCYDDDRSPHFLAREYFGSFVPTQLHRSMEEVVKDMSANPQCIGVVPLQPGKDTACWWEVLPDAADAPVVFAILPFVRSRQDITTFPNAFAIGKVELLPTSEDITVFVLEVGEPARSGDWATWYGKAIATISLQQAGLEVSPSGKSALLGVYGFHYGDKAKLDSLVAAMRQASENTVTGGHCIGAYVAAYKHGNAPAHDYRP